MTTLPMTGRQKISERCALYNAVGSYQMDIPTGLGTLIAAGDFTNAGQLFVFRWDSAVRNAYVHYIGARFLCTTAFDTDQEVGCKLVLASSFTVDGTNGTAVDCGSTVVATGRVRETMAKSAIGAGDVRTATTAAITAGTHTLHANAFSSINGWIAEVGNTIPAVGSVNQNGFAPLYDSRENGMPLVFDEDSGFIIINSIVMGAAGVGRWHFRVCWDEGTDA